MIQSGYAGPRRSLVARAVAAARLDSGVFEEVEADNRATGQAAVVVLIAALAEGLGSQKGLIGIPVGLCSAFLGWILWSAVTYFIGVTVFKGTATLGELLRTLGFAHAPAVFYVLRMIPIIAWLVAPVVGIWVLIAGIIALRQALDIDTWKAVVTAVIGWLVLIIPMIIFFGILRMFIG
jgi:hypothetical protein